MQHEVQVQLFEELLPGTMALLLFSYGQSSLVFELDSPDRLTQWLAFLFQHRDQPHPSSAPVRLEVGRFGPYPVEFCIEAGDMMLVAGVLDQPHEVEMATAPEPGPMGLVPSLTLYIPGELLDDLADGLAREHRHWVEHRPPPEKSVENPCPGREPEV